MTALTVAILLLYAVGTAMAGSRWLPGAAWTLRAPRTAIAIWLAAGASIVGAVVTAGVALAVPCLPSALTLAGFRTCLDGMWAQYSTPAGTLSAGLGSLLVLSVLGRIAWCTGAALADGHQRRARHDEVLTMVARPGPDGVRIIEDDQPAVYCLPGRRQIVLTTGAMRCLQGRQLDAVLAHERAHLAGRHHLLLTVSRALQSAFPHLRFFSLAATQVGELVEVAADDAATRREHRLTLAGALLAVAAAGTPVGALGAGGTADAQRVRRLIDPPRRLSRTEWALTSATLAATSLFAVVAPATAFIAAVYCFT